MTDEEREWLKRRQCPTILLHRLLSDGRVVEVEAMLLDQARLCVGPLRSLGYDDTWDYADVGSALLAAVVWDGEGEPSGWTRHVVPRQGGAYYRPEGDPAREWFKPAEG